MFSFRVIYSHFFSKQFLIKFWFRVTFPWNSEFTSFFYKKLITDHISIKFRAKFSLNFAGKSNKLKSRVAESYTESVLPVPWPGRFQTGQAQNTWTVNRNSFLSSYMCQVVQLFFVIWPSQQIWSKSPLSRSINATKYIFCLRR